MRDRVRALGAALRRSAGGRGAFSAGLRFKKKRSFELAVEAFEDAERAFTAELGASHQYVVQSIAHRASCYLEMDRPDLGAPLFEQALRIEEESRGRRTALAQAYREQLAWAYDRLGRPEEASRMRSESGAG